MIRLKKFRCGFTLIELLIVIGIIALLLAILLPSFGKAKSMAMRLKCAHNLKQINVAVSLYLGDNKDTYPCADIDDPIEQRPGGGNIWLWMGRGWRSFVEPYLGGNIDANNPSVLHCPQDKSEDYESTSYSYSMTFYHSPAQIDSINNTVNTCGGPGNSLISPTPQRVFDVAKPSEKILMGEWNSNHLRVDETGWYGEGGWWCWEGSRNYLFADGQVQYIPAEEIRPARDGWPDANLTFNGIKGSDYP
ncbi:MAG: prepilin-type N-terminal cleavage/methylation domain-containing protein [Planctomycetes bacterium]|nr:prepilin-type N-terminal cleavage/methylation domain-containing protein [Planctomycetota bacterium]